MSTHVGRGSSSVRSGSVHAGRATLDKPGLLDGCAQERARELPTVGIAGADLSRHAFSVRVRGGFAGLRMRWRQW